MPTCRADHRQGGEVWRAQLPPAAGGAQPRRGHFHVGRELCTERKAATWACLLDARATVGLHAAGSPRHGHPPGFAADGAAARCGIWQLLPACGTRYVRCVGKLTWRWCCCCTHGTDGTAGGQQEVLRLPVRLLCNQPGALPPQGASEHRDDRACCRCCGVPWRWRRRLWCRPSCLTAEPAAGAAAAGAAAAAPAAVARAGLPLLCLLRTARQPNHPRMSGSALPCRSWTP